jgi:hypothetical protein
MALAALARAASVQFYGKHAFPWPPNALLLAGFPWAPPAELAPVFKHVARVEDRSAASAQHLINTIAVSAGHGQL